MRDPVSNFERAIGVLEEQGRWLASEFKKMDTKLDALIDSHNYLKWKVHAVTAGIAVVTAGLFEMILAFIRH